MNIKTNYNSYGQYWYAVNEDSYDGLSDGNNEMGVGETEQDAIDDLTDKLESIKE